MMIRDALMAAVVLLISSVSAADGPTRQVKGRVVDESGRPVAGASVSGFWGSNGLTWDQVVAVREVDPERLWHDEGKMEPWGDARAVTDADGRFSIAGPELRETLLVCDRERRRGAVVVFDPGRLDRTFEARLLPLIRVHGMTRIAGSRTPLTWSCVYLNMPFDEAKPLNRTRTAICGSFNNRFEFCVPPGTYSLNASSDNPPSASIEARTITLTADRPEVDLDSLVLRPRLGVQERIDKAKANGTWGDFRENLGKEPPRWHLTDAKGVAKTAELSDFKGRWVVLYFWSPGCAPCLKNDLPKLMRFYDDHKIHRDRFEILAFCCDFDETLNTIGELETRLESVKKAVWGGRDLPFPVLLDRTFKTYERFGLEGNGVSTYLLIDPSGRLVKGDLNTLAAELDRLARP